jgi:hypothetical protein
MLSKNEAFCQEENFCWIQKLHRSVLRKLKEVTELIRETCYINNREFTCTNPYARRMIKRTV